MTTAISNFKALNNLAERIIDLHQHGFVNDYELKSDIFVSCQDGTTYRYEQVSVNLVGHGCEEHAKRNYYLHTVTTCDGMKGILLTYATIACTAPRICKLSAKTIDAFWDAF